MKILVLHRIPYHKISYDRGIDHSLHEVVYVGKKAILDTIPSGFRCTKIERPGKESAFEEIRDIFPRDFHFDQIISLSEYELLDAAKLREYFEVPGPKYKDVLLVRDKLMMKEAVARAGIRVPRNLSCAEINVNFIPWKGRTVLKPLRGASSDGVHIFESKHEAISKISNYFFLQENFDLSEYEIEEFIEGPILHFDGLVKNGEIQAFMASRYIGTCFGYAGGKPLGSVQLDEASTEVMRNWSSRVLEALKHSNGAFHLEAILSDEGPVFLEIGARVGGADVVEVFEHAMGVHLPSEELKLILGISSNLKIRKSSDFFGWFVFPGHHLRAERCAIERAQMFSTRKNIVKWKQNAICPSNVTYQAHEVPIAGIIKGTSHFELAQMMQEMFENIVVRKEFREELSEEVETTAAAI